MVIDNYFDYPNAFEHVELQDHRTTKLLILPRAQVLSDYVQAGDFPEVSTRH